MTTFESTFDEKALQRVLLTSSVHPDDTATLPRYVPGGLTHMCWRNSVLEEWHGGPQSRISDAEMMRANVSTTRIFHQNLWYAVGDWWAEVGPLSSQPIDVDLLSAAFAGALNDGFDADRLLPHGIALGELGGDEYDDLLQHAEQQLGALLLMAGKHGARRVIMWLGLRGLLSVSHWWGSPKWPFIVDEMLRRLDEPDHEHWRVGGHPGTHLRLQTIVRGSASCSFQPRTTCPPRSSTTASTRRPSDSSDLSPPPDSGQRHARFHPEPVRN